MRWLRQAMLYAGLDRDEFHELLPEAREENGRFLQVYTALLAVIFSVCLLMSYPAGGQLAQNRPIYYALVIFYIVLNLCTSNLLPKHPSLSPLFTFLFILSIYAYSYAIAFLRPSNAATAAVCFLILIPCIFNYRPLSMILITISSIVLYFVLALRYKTQSMALLDLWNSLFFGVIAVGLCIYQMRVKFRLLLQKQRNRQLSETDLLTGVKNRNCYEQKKDQYPQKCVSSLACFFIDANGLHELNNREGHEVGDNMLRATAAAIRQFFDTEDIFRVGGDEFITFCADAGPEEIESRIQGIQDTLKDQGYSVSIGAARHPKEDLNMDELLKEAEAVMYERKRDYYENSEHERRRSGV